MVDSRRTDPNLSIAAAKTKGKNSWHDNDNERWPGIASRFQLVILVGRRSKQLFNGARPRIPADPLKQRNTSIALEEFRRGLIPFRGQNGNESQAVFASIDTIVNPTVVEHDPDFDLTKSE